MTELPHRSGTRTATSLVADVLSRVPELTDALVRTIDEHNPGYRRMNVVPTNDLWQSCHDNLVRVLQLVARTDDDTEAYDAARSTGRLRAQQRMPLDDVLRSFRLGGRLVWEALIGQARSDGRTNPDELLDLASRVWAVVDSTSAQVALAYHATEREVVRVDEQRRAALWEGLLHGRAKEPAFAHQAAQGIGVPVDSPYAVAVVDTGQPLTPPNHPQPRTNPSLTPEGIPYAGHRGPAATAAHTADHTAAHTADPAAALTQGATLECPLAALGVTSVWQVRGHTLVGLIAAAETTLPQVLKALQDNVTAPASLSMVVQGLAQVDVAYRQAVLARETVPDGHVQVAALAERLPEALLMNSPDLAQALVQRRLGSLLRLSVAERGLLLRTLGA
jgi:hypothetical protein